MEGHDQTGGIDQCKEVIFLFPITPVFNWSLQCSHNQSISLISQPQDQCTIILSLSLTTSTCHIRSCTHTTPTNPPASISISIITNLQQSSSTIYNPPIFSINHRSAPGSVTTPIIDLGLDSFVDISCIGMYVYKHIPADITKHTCPRDLLIENDASPRTVNLTRMNKDRSRAGESLKLQVGYSTC